MTTTYTFPYSGRTVTWDGGGAYGVGPDGTLIIQDAPRNVRVLAYTPAFDPAGPYHGAIKNPSGRLRWDRVGWDARATQGGPNDTVPIELDAGDSLVMLESRLPGETTGGFWTPTGYSASQTETYAEYMDAIVVVPYDPTNAATTMMTPPIFGNSQETRNLRMLNLGGLGIPLALITNGLSNLTMPIVLDAAAATAINTKEGSAITAATFDTQLATLESKFRRMSGDMFESWYVDVATPGFQHPGYGATVSGTIGAALVCLMSTRWTNEQKKTLAIGLAQWAIHYLGAILDGRQEAANGGNYQGRKILLLYLGKLLRWPWLINIGEQLFLATGETRFCEDLRFRDGFCFGGTSEFPTWYGQWAAKVPWFYQSMNGELWATTPALASWGSPTNGGTWAWFVNNYYRQTMAAMVGIGLFANLHEIESAHSAPAQSAIRNWMSPSLDPDTGTPGSQSIHTGLAAIGIDFTTGATQWGDDYGNLDGITGLCSYAWRTYAIDFVS